MAEKLELVRGYDFRPDAGTVSLLDYQHGVSVAYDGWTPKTELQKDGLIHEAITLRITGSDIDDLASNMQSLQQRIYDVQQYTATPSEPNGVWLRVQMYGESNPRQSWVSDMKLEAASSAYETSLRVGSAPLWREHTLGISRMPWWEATTPGTFTAGSVRVVGGTVGFSAIAGDMPARIAEVYITHTSGTLIVPGGQVWIGFRTSRYGIPGSFVPWWSFGKPPYPYGGQVGYIPGGGSVVGDSLAYSGGSAIEFQPSVVAYQPNQFVAGMMIVSQTAAASEQRGDYLVLCRARVTGSSDQWLLQLQAGWGNEWYYPAEALGNPEEKVFPHAKILPRVWLDYWATYRLYEMGIVSIPPDARLVDQRSLESYGLMLYAERIAGSGKLHIDGLVLIPLEGYVWAGHLTPSDNAVSATSASMYAVQSPDGQLQSSVITLTDWGYPGAHDVDAPFVSSAPIIVNGFPAGSSGIMVVAASTHVRANDWRNAIGVRIKYFPRWRSLRGGA